jgi:hypothetical protein
LAALARSYLCPQPPLAYAVLSLARTYSEMISIVGGMPTAVRVLSWGRDNLLRRANHPRIGVGEEAPATLSASGPQASFGGTGSAIPENSTFCALDTLVQLMNGQSIGQRVYVTGLGELNSDFDFTTNLANRLGNGVECQAVNLAPGPAGSIAILGLQRVLDREPAWPPLELQLRQTDGKARLEHRVPVKFVATALALLLVALVLPYAEALTLKSHLANKLAGIKADQGRLVTIDRELDFLQYLKENEPPYLDALLVFAKSAPPGTRFDSVSMNRRGEVSIRGSLRDGQQVADLRSKLIDSGFFANVSIDEQAPTPDRQKVNVRISAQWKPAVSRSMPSIEASRGPGEPKSSPNQTAAGPSPAHGTSAPILSEPLPKKGKG